MVKTLKRAAFLAVAMLLCNMAAEASAVVDRLGRRSASGRISVCAAGNRFPGNAAVSLTRTRDVQERRREI